LAERFKSSQRLVNWHGDLIRDLPITCLLGQLFSGSLSVVGWRWYRDCNVSHYREVDLIVVEFSA